MLAVWVDAWLVLVSYLSLRRRQRHRSLQPPARQRHDHRVRRVRRGRSGAAVRQRYGSGAVPYEPQAGLGAVGWAGGRGSGREECEGPAAVLGGELQLWAGQGQERHFVSASSLVCLWSTCPSSPPASCRKAPVPALEAPCKPPMHPCTIGARSDFAAAQASNSQSITATHAPAAAA